MRALLSDPIVCIASAFAYSRRRFVIHKNSTRKKSKRRLTASQTRAPYKIPNKKIPTLVGILGIKLCYIDLDLLQNLADGYICRYMTSNQRHQ